MKPFAENNKYSRMRPKENGWLLIFLTKDVILGSVHG